MKIQKTQKGHRLHAMGFPVAIKFACFTDESADSNKAKRWLTEHYGATPWASWEKKNHPWCSMLGRWSRKTGQFEYIGLKDEQILSALLLILS